MTEHPTTQSRIADGRDEVIELAYRPWQLIGAGRLEDGLALLDDSGTWWAISSRTTTPMAEIKPTLRGVFGLIGPSFEFTDAIVESDRVALMVECRADLPDGVAFHNVCTFITRVDLDRGVVVEVREYVDSLHSAQTLKPAMAAAGVKASG
ncbi:hypothetical protein CRI77_19880 [Mycolicibacterium duvalii]|uniref:Uncharacterized protein n=1 Tax=Mycolicibacterium duvalii TaxID=39688 RepID=A0A7I7K0E9_9MYCO|nr:hypothetical protein [Mycolicibacterium duvalii]MCV7370748.1 hypothetical protein [Mycolicibacterium duvalii]PEG37880.1 hypothetical protein CRI77_19880 [Mycolicibacterium duvalii]BBX16989.1 hypothetical protein MDUV_18490 [Mycolicibacterium duvalii]